VVQRGVLDDVEHRTSRAGAWIDRSEHQPPDPRVHHRGRTHRTRLERHVQRRVGQAVGLQSLAGRAQRDDLGMRRRIAGADGTVPSFGNDGAVTHDDRADRDLAPRFGHAGEFQSPAHEGDIGQGH
jgi:hypothetical protein